MKTSIKNIAAVAVLTLYTASAHAQLEGSALNYMLQRPRVAKQYADKQLFDHLFVDAGAGVNIVGYNNPDASAFGQINLGDWITPEHGWRLGINAGYSRLDGIKAKYAGLSLDYLMNITALSKRGTTYNPRTFELYGIAGVDLATSRHEGNAEYGMGAHIGLRGQVALSPFTYLYIEPKVGLMSDRLSQVETWHGYRPFTTAMMGLGYRLPEARLKGTGYSHRRFIDGLFIGMAGGPAFLANVNGKVLGDMGARLTGSVGRWFDNYNALRLSGNATLVKQPGENKVKAVGAQLDYLLNLHHAFGGINTDRWFWINGVAGISYNYTTDAMGDHKNVFGAGAGLQANVRMSRELSFTVEPRVDFYGDDYAQHTTSYRNKLDITPSVLAGLTYTYHGRSLTAKPTDKWHSLGWHDHMFIEGAVGANLIVARRPITNMNSYLRPQAYVGVGKWYTPVSGARVWAQVARTQWSDNNDYNTHFTVGADYLLNLTNAFYGYRSNRAFDFTAAVGVNVSKNGASYVGVDASLRGTWHVSRLMGLFVEPRLLAYSDNYMPSSLSTTGVDLLANVNVGMQFNMDGFERSLAQHQVRDNGDWHRSSFTMAAGMTNRVGQLKEWKRYSPIARLSYTQWFSPYMAWRGNLQGMVSRKEGTSRCAQAFAGADLLLDLTSYTYGYDASRPLAVRALVGTNVGVDYGNHYYSFAPDLHLGGQLAIRLTNHLCLIAEPQVAFNLSARYSNRQRQRIMPQMMMGLDYSLQRSRRNADLDKTPEHPNVVSVSMGTGVNSENFGSRQGIGPRLSFVSDISYGRWLDGVNGVHAGISNSVIQRNGKGNESITSIHAGYMMNINSAVTGESTDYKTFQLTGIAAASLNIASWKNHDTKVAPGLMGAVQAGVKVSPNVEIYLEPSATVFTKKIALTPMNHPVEGELKLSLGTKVNF